MKRIFALLFLFCLVHSGCWATWSELRKEQQQRELLEEKVVSMQRSQRKLQTEFRLVLSQTIRKLEAHLAQNKAQLVTVQTQVEELKKSVSKGNSGVAEMFETLQALERKFQKSIGQIQTLQQQSTELLKSKPELLGKYNELQKSYSELLKSQKDLAEQAIPARSFAKAKNAYKRKDWKVASKLFKRFLQQFPSHELSGSSRIYLGDVLQKKGKNNEAIVVYDDVLKKNSSSKQVPVALFKLGRLHYQIGLCEQGKSYFQKLTRYRRHTPVLSKSAWAFLRNAKRLCKHKKTRKSKKRKR